MTSEKFWEALKKDLDVPFSVEEVTNIDFDPLGVMYFDLEDGSTYALSFSKCESFEDDDL